MIKITEMASFLEPCNTGSPSMSKAEDNLSNSEGPLLKKSVGKKGMTSSIENISVLKPSRSPSRSTTNDQSNLSFDCEKRRYCLWTLTIILTAIGLSNLLLSITIISVLRLSRGMEALEVIPDESLIKFYGVTDLDHVCIEEGICQGYGDESVELTGDGGGIHLTVKNRRHDHIHSTFQILQNGTSVSTVESFEIKHPKTGDAFFSTNFPNFGLPSGVGHINVQVAETHRIVAPINESLTIESRGRSVEIHGAESLKIDSREIVWVADNDVKLKSNESIVLKADKGIFLDPKKIPIVSGLIIGGNGNVSPQFKVCVCMPEGKLFRVQVPPGNVRVNCAKVSTFSQNNPCA